MIAGSSVIGAQLYTLREHLKTPAQIVEACGRVRQMGYEAVQVSGLGPIDPKELARILNDEGLKCAATHLRAEQMADVSWALDYHATLGCRYTATSHMSARTKEDWLRWIDEFNRLAAPLAAGGIRVGYHNHSHELARFDGQTALEMLIGGLDAAIWFEIDTYWIAHGGGDPAQWIEKVAGRLPCVHLKDMAITPEREPFMCEVGEGNLNWPEVLAACRRAKVEWYLVERDQGELDAFESLRISLQNLRRMGLR